MVDGVPGARGQFAQGHVVAVFKTVAERATNPVRRTVVCSAKSSGIKFAIARFARVPWTAVGQSGRAGHAVA